MFSLQNLSPQTCYWKIPLASQSHLKSYSDIPSHILPIICSISKISLLLIITTHVHMVGLLLCIHVNVMQLLCGVPFLLPSLCGFWRSKLRLHCLLSHFPGAQIFNYCSLILMSNKHCRIPLGNYWAYLILSLPRLYTFFKSSGTQKWFMLIKSKTHPEYLTVYYF